VVFLGRRRTGSEKVGSTRAHRVVSGAASKGVKQEKRTQQTTEKKPNSEKKSNWNGKKTGRKALLTGMELKWGLDVRNKRKVGKGGEGVTHFQDLTQTTAWVTTEIGGGNNKKKRKRFRKARLR